MAFIDVKEVFNNVKTAAFIALMISFRINQNICSTNMVSDNKEEMPLQILGTVWKCNRETKTFCRIETTSRQIFITPHSDGYKCEQGYSVTLPFLISFKLNDYNSVFQAEIVGMTEIIMNITWLTLPQTHRRLQMLSKK